MDIRLPSTSLSSAAVFVSVFTLYYAGRLFFRPRRHLPPGPKPLPFVGNVFDLPSTQLERCFAQWGERYGDVVYIQLFGQPMVVLHTLEAARDLLEKRSAIYSDRPRFVLFSELMGWEAASTHVHYGPRFRKHRRFIQQTFNQRAVTALRPLQEEETLKLLIGLTHSPGRISQHLRRYAAAVILKITYGREITSVDDLFVQLAERAATLTVESGTPAATLVDFFPVLRHIPTWAPFSGFKRDAIKVKVAVDDMMNIPFNFVKEEMRAGVAIPSFTSTLLEACRQPGENTVSPEDEADIKGAAGTLFAAAEDTTVSALETFFLAMTLHPEAYRKAQAEMDTLGLQGRLPDLNDRPSLPYLECVLKEVLRWSPPVPLGMPHRLMEDDIYKGYLIPKGSTIVANIHSIMYNCPDPESFKPERHMDNDSLDPWTAVFGFGRRACPGKYLAEVGIWIVTAAAVATLNIEYATDEHGAPIVPPVQFKEGFVRHPENLKCHISPREGWSNIFNSANTLKDNIES